MQKLKGAHPFMRDWFLNDVKPKWPDAHVSWAFRGEQDQNAFVAQGRSNEVWPYSTHNHMEGGEPCSLALDLFVIDETGKASYPPRFFHDVNAMNESDNLPIVWGATFRTIHDGDHFEFRPDV